MAIKIGIALFVLAFAGQSYQQDVEVPNVDEEAVRAAINEHIDEDLPQIAIDCKAKSNAVDMSPLFAAETTEESFSEELKCYLRCMFTSKNVITKGVFNKATFSKVVNPLASAAITKCGAIKPASTCEYAFQVFLCLKQNPFLLSVLAE